ncbi:DNA transposase THAP9 isoform X2 [Zonotrichia leucophrys gambelii]|uniref:DNA transposase THAP9 isoform X2 n=1 Tax=Zonotrichia leucophrys gambelii TaxID=257770 RepID=UPI003140406D
MTRSCSALGCTARDTGRSRERGISFHQFPVDAAQRREWIRAVNRVDPQSRRAWRPGPGAILCSRHFAEGDFECYGLRRKLRRGAVPSRFLPSEPPGAGRTKSSTPGRALKQPLPSPPAGDHNYSLQGQRAAPPRPPPPHAPQHQAQPPAAAGTCGPAPRRRSVPSILRELAAKRQLSEEIVSLLQAQFSAGCLITRLLQASAVTFFSSFRKRWREGSRPAAAAPCWYRTCPCRSSRSGTHGASSCRALLTWEQASLMLMKLHWHQKR